jgi:TatA/E family protein of Tat protein translocase
MTFARRTTMLGPIGMQELIIIFVIALIVFGPRKLPQLGKSLGKSLAEFKRASNELRSTLEEEIRVEETRREIMEPIESIGREAKALVEKAEKEAEASLAEAEREETAASIQPEEPAHNVQKT